MSVLPIQGVLGGRRKIARNGDLEVAFVTGHDLDPEIGKALDRLGGVNSFEAGCCRIPIGAQKATGIEDLRSLNPDQRGRVDWADAVVVDSIDRRLGCQARDGSSNFGGGTDAGFEQLEGHKGTCSIVDRDQIESASLDLARQ